MMKTKKRAKKVLASKSDTKRIIFLAEKLLEGMPSCYCAASSEYRMGGPHADDCDVAIYYKRRIELTALLRKIKVT